MCRAHHGGRSELQREGAGNGIAGIGGRLDQRDGSEVFAIEVFGPPALDFDWPIIPDGLRRKTVFERREIHEWLERRAWLAPRRNRTIELVFRIAAAADKRPDRAVRRHRHERALLD